VKKTVAVLGNCQAQEMERILLTHAPFLDRYALDATTPVFQMTADDMDRFSDRLDHTDILIHQHLGSQFGKIATSEVVQRTRLQRIEFPSMWFSGHIPDAANFRDAAVPKIGHTPSVYQSIIIASAVQRGLGKDETFALYTDPDCIARDDALAFYDSGLAELRRREAQCQAVISDEIEAAGRSTRLFHVMNHPCSRIVVHALNQILAILDVEPVDGATVEDKLSMVRWPIIPAIRQTFDIAGDQTPFVGIPIDLPLFVDYYWTFYTNNPAILETNGAQGRLKD